MANIPPKKITGVEAYHNWIRFPLASWRVSPKLRDQRDPASARIFDDYFIADFQPTFRIKPSDKIFAIGSCFARNIELYLQKMGLELESIRDVAPFEEAEHTGPHGVLNRYNTFSVLNELRWAFGEEPYPESAVVDYGDGTCIDPHVYSDMPLTQERIKERRQLISSVFARLRHCNVVIITLGLVEAWRDTVTGHVLNTAPPFKLFKSRGRFAEELERYSFELLSAEDNIRALDEIHRLLLKYCSNDIKLSITVSPVPLRDTFTGRDIVIANMYSKSTLRVAAEEFARGLDNVDYFASYESVLYSERVRTWYEDKRHVREPMVERIVKQYLGAYLEDTSLLTDTSGKRDVVEHSGHK